jgi:hypothetical protein
MYSMILTWKWQLFLMRKWLRQSAGQQDWLIGLLETRNEIKHPSAGRQLPLLCGRTIGVNAEHVTLDQICLFQYELSIGHCT